MVSVIETMLSVIVLFILVVPMIAGGYFFWTLSAHNIWWAVAALFCYFEAFVQFCVGMKK